MQVEQYFSDDYAGLTSGKYTFYYGYEETNENYEWLFTVKENGKRIYQLTTSEIEQVNKNDLLRYPVNYLLAGIGIWMLLYK